MNLAEMDFLYSFIRRILKLQIANFHSMSPRCPAYRGFLVLPNRCDRPSFVALPTSFQKATRCLQENPKEHDSLARELLAVSNAPPDLL